MIKIFKKDRNRIDGKEGEDIAAKFLKEKGFKILERNFRTRTGEADIVAMDGDDLVFVEVKARANGDREFLLGCISAGKERRIIKTAEYYMEKNSCDNLNGRFDVVFIVKNSDGTRIEHIEDAFTGD